jgi:predicted RND superfamily exporter protein
MQMIFKRPFVIVITITIITLFFAAFLPQVEFSSNNFRFISENDPALSTARWIDNMFGSSLFILVGLQREFGTVFDSDFLNLIRTFVEEIKEFDIVKDVVSLVSADYITSIDGAIVVEPLVGSGFSGTPQEIAELKHRLLSWDLYERGMISDDFSSTQILIPLTISQDFENRSEFLEIRDIAYAMFDNHCAVYVTGMPIIASIISEQALSDLYLLVPLVVIVVLIVLFFSFRKFSKVILPLITVLIAVIWSVGAMPLFGIKLSIITIVLPVILMAMGSAYGIHVVTHYITDKGNKVLDRDEHRQIVIDVYNKIKGPVFLVAITTCGGFASLCFTSILPIREFGFFSTFGVISVFVIALTFIPSLLIISGPEKTIKQEKKVGQNTAIADSLVLVAAKKKTIITIAVCILLLSVYGLTKVISDNAMIEYFKPDSAVYKSDLFVRENFGGSKIVNVVLHSDNPEEILHPHTLSALDGLGRYLQTIPNTGKVMGFTDMIKRINQVLNINSPPEGLERTEDTFLSDDFGFWGFSDFTETETEDDFYFNDQVNDNFYVSHTEEIYLTQNEFFSILDRAASTSRTLSVNDLVKELKRQVNYEGMAYYEIPNIPSRYGKDTYEDLQRLISNYLFLLSAGISSYANDPLEPTAIKSTIQLRTVGMADSREIIDNIERFLSFHVPANVNVTIGGATLVEGSLNDQIVRSQIISLVFSIFCIFIMITIYNKSAVAGIISVAPLSISILINFAVMGFAGIKLNLGTAMVASVGVAIGIDYSIHFLEAFKREYRKHGDSKLLLWHSFNSSGKAIIINAISVGAGFSVLLFSRFNILMELGLLIAITMFTSALISLTVLPVLLVLIKPKFLERNNPETVYQEAHVSEQILD